MAERLMKVRSGGSGDVAFEREISLDARGGWKTAVALFAPRRQQRRRCYMCEAVGTTRWLEVATLSKQSPDPVANAEAKLRAAERVVHDLETKSQRLVQRGKEIGDQIAALGYRATPRMTRLLVPSSISSWPRQ
jgi:hypothetical protein